jgi:hypothetical protein
MTCEYQKQKKVIAGDRSRAVVTLGVGIIE